MADRDIEDFGGAQIPRNPTEATWVCIAQALSPDGEKLVRVYVSTLGYRVQAMKKTRGAPPRGGMWWSEAAPPIGASGREDALQMMTTLSGA